MEKQTVIIISANTSLREACQHAFQGFHDLQIETMTDIAHFRAWAPGKSVSAILIELKTLISSSPEERVLINDLTDSLPVAKMRLDPQTEQIMASVDTEALIGPELFNYIVERLKSQRLQRQIRRFPRKKTLFNVRIRHEFFGGEDFLSSTVDISQDGMFVIAGNSPPLGSQVQIQVQELGGEEWIQAGVRWTVPWGRSTSHFPGFGVQFLQVHPKQERKLLQLIGLVASDMPTPDELGES